MSLRKKYTYIPLDSIVKTALLIVMCLILQVDGMAQIDDNQTDLLKPFQAKLAKSRKFESVPLPPLLDSSINKNQSYQVPTHLYDITYPQPFIRPLAMPTGKNKKNFPFYAKLGIGYPVQPFAEIGYHDYFKNFDFGAHAKHHSLLQPNLQDQQFTQTHIDLNTTYFTKKGVAIGGDINFDYNTNRFYGIDSFDRELVSEDSLSQRFINFDIALHLFNSKISSIDFNYKGDLDFYFYSDGYSSREIGLAPQLFLEKWFGKSKKKHALSADIGLSFLSFNDGQVDSLSVKADRLLFYFNPRLTLNFGNLKAKLGLDLGTNEGDFYILPDVELSYGLAKGIFTFYAGAKGEIIQNSFRGLTRMNEFLVSNPLLKHTSYLEFYGGARGSIKKIGYDFRGGYAMTQNLPYFLNDMDSLQFAPYWRFRPVYDTANVIFFRGMFDCRIVKNLTIGTVMQYNVYVTRNFEKAFHLPTFESNIFVSYDLYLNPKKKPDSHFLSFSLECYLNAGVPYLDQSYQVDVLDGLYDINIGLKYTVSEHVSLFLDINNIINNRNQRWNGYRQLGLNGMIGAELIF